VARAAGAEHVEKFNALQFLAESVLKYLTLTLHTAVSDLDPSTRQFIGYQLARADGLGAWDESLDPLDQAIRRTGGGHEPRALIDFLSLKRTGASAADWFDALYKAADALWRETTDQGADFTRSIRG